MTDDERREMLQSNWAAQMNAMGYDASGNPLDTGNHFHDPDDGYFGRHEKIDLSTVKNAKPGDSFHGEVWARCPSCYAAYEMVSTIPVSVKEGYRIYRCRKCGELFKDR